MHALSGIAAIRARTRPPVLQSHAHESTVRRNMPAIRADPSITRTQEHHAFVECTTVLLSRPSITRTREHHVRLVFMQALRGLPFLNEIALPACLHGMHGEPPPLHANVRRARRIQGARPIQHPNKPALSVPRQNPTHPVPQQARPIRQIPHPTCPLRPERTNHPTVTVLSASPYVL